MALGGLLMLFASTAVLAGEGSINASYASEPDRNWYTYVAFNTNPNYDSTLRHLIISENERAIVEAGYGVEGVRFCSSDEEFYCFSSDLLSFFVPRDGPISTGQEWSADGYRYRVLDSVAIGHANSGQNWRIIGVHEIRDADKTVFYYSRERGLRAIGKISAGRPYTSFYLSTDEVGYGAAAIHYGP